MSLRQDGTATVTRSAVALLHGEAEPGQRRRRPRRAGRRRRPGSPAGRSAALALRCQAGSAPADTTSLASPPHSSWISRVAASIAARQQRRVDAALEALAGVGDDAVPPPGQRHAHRVEQRAFDEHAGGRLGAAGRLAAHHAGQRLHAGRVGDHAIRRVGRVVAAVQRAEGLAGAGPEAQHAALHPVGVEHVQRPAEVEGEEVGDVDQRVDRPQPDAGQPRLQPGGARPVAQAADRAARAPRGRPPACRSPR